MADSFQNLLPESRKERDVRLISDVLLRVSEVLDATHGIDNLKTIDLGPVDDPRAWTIGYIT